MFDLIKNKSLKRYFRVINKIYFLFLQSYMYGQLRVLLATIMTKH